MLEQAVLNIGKLCLMLAQAKSAGPSGGTTPPGNAGPSDGPQPARDAAPVSSETPSAAGQGASAPGAIPLAQFLRQIQDQELTPAERDQVAEVAEAMLEQLYVHLPLKRAMHAVDPIQRLRILRRRIDTMSPRAFHSEMIAIFHALRDLHTNYVLPAVYQGSTAFLPFLVEHYYGSSDDPKHCHFTVGRLLTGLTHPDFGVGVNLTHWNGMPIWRAVELNAEREAGSNHDARLARGLEALTIRPMGLSAPPDEEWVVVGYEAGGQRHDLRFDWMVFEPPPAPSGIPMSASAPGIGNALGLDARTEAVRRAKKALFYPQKMEVERQMCPVTHARPSAGGDDESECQEQGPSRTPVPAYSSVLGVDAQTESVRQAKNSLESHRETPGGPTLAAASEPIQAAAVDAAPSDVSVMPDVFDFKRVSGPQGELGYIRIYTFMVFDADAFLNEFVRIARLLPQTGLIIDLRGNGGGNILAGERLLQVLTPRPIDPQRFHFINTPTSLHLCRNAPVDLDLARWAPSIEVAVETGETYSQGLTLEPVELYNRMGQQYQGPVVLIVDALCYSTTDIFSAGFQDHKIGKILGTSQHTGAGGANVWEYGLLQSALPNQFPILPKGTTFRVAIRRTTRVGGRAGVPVEDLGVEADEIHQMTRADVLQGNTDLIAHAARILAEQPVRSLAAAIDRSNPSAAIIRVRAVQITRIDLYQAGRPLDSKIVVDGSAEFSIPAGARSGDVLELRGFDSTGLVAVATVSV